MNDLNAQTPMELPQSNFGGVSVDPMPAFVSGTTIGPVSTKPLAQTAPEPVEEPKIVPPVVVVEPVPAPAPKPVVVDNSPVTRQEFNDMKSQVNDSFEELANLLLELEHQREMFNERVDRYNAKSSHKL